MGKLFIYSALRHTPKYEHYFCTTPDPNYNDTVTFDWKKTTATLVFDDLFKPLIDWMVDMGFAAVRLDYIAGIAAENIEFLKIATDYLAKKLPPNAVIFGEWLTKHRQEGKEKLSANKIQINYYMNSITDAICNVLFNNSTKKLKLESLNLNAEERDWLFQEIFEKTNITCSCGTIGAPATHGSMSLAKLAKNAYKFQYGCEPTHEQLCVMMKSLICIAAITSNGGWYLTSTDEFGDDRVRGTTFMYTHVDLASGEQLRINNFKMFRSRPLLELSKYTNIDLTDFIRELNTKIIDKLHYPQEKCQPPEIRFKFVGNIFIASGNFDFNGSNYIICDLSGRSIKLMPSCEAPRKIYNLPICHIPLTQTTQEQLLQAIRLMGFTHLWLEPFLAVGDKTIVTRSAVESGKSYFVTGSLYGQTLEKSRDDKGYLFLQTLVKKGGPFAADITIQDEASSQAMAILKFTKFIAIAKGLGLIPMFDLILNHVSVDSKILSNPVYAKFFVTKDQNSDVVAFDCKSTSPKIIFATIIKPLIDWLIDCLGFEAVHVNMPNIANVGLLEEAILYLYSKLLPKAIILGEWRGDTKALQLDKLMLTEQTQISSAINSELLNQLIVGQKQDEVLCFDSKYLLNKLETRSDDDRVYISSVGSVASHTSITLARACMQAYYKKHTQFPDVVQLQKMMQLNILITGIVSSCKWCLTGGDEFGINCTRSLPFLFTHVDIPHGGPMLFDNFALSRQQLLTAFDKTTNINLCDFIRGFNKFIVDKFLLESKTSASKINFYLYEDILVMVGNFSIEGRNYIAVDLRKPYLQLIQDEKLQMLKDDTEQLVEYIKAQAPLYLSHLGPVASPCMCICPAYQLSRPELIEDRLPAIPTAAPGSDTKQADKLSTFCYP